MNYLLYLVSYFFLSLMSIGVNLLLGMAPGIAPNIVVQVFCAAFLIKRITKSTSLGMRLFVLPVFFALVAITYLFFLQQVFPIWHGKEITIPTLTLVFVINYLVGLGVAYFLSRKLSNN